MLFNLSVWSWNTRCISGHSRFAFFLQRNTTNCTASVLETGTSYDMIFAFAGIMVECSSLLGFYSSSMFILVHVWSFQDAVSERTKFWRSRSGMNLDQNWVLKPRKPRWDKIWHEIIQDLRKTATFSELVNAAISTQLAIDIADKTLYFPVHISKTLRPDGMMNALTTVLAVIRFWGMLIMSAEIKAKVRECVNHITTETYFSEGWVDNFPNHIASITMEKIAVKFARRYDVDYAFLGPVRSIYAYLTVFGKLAIIS